MKNLRISAALAAFAIALGAATLASCKKDGGGEEKKPYAAYFGTWKNEHGDIVTIASNKISYSNGTPYEYTIENLTWTPYAEPYDDQDYPEGYKITGKRTAGDYPLPGPDGSWDDDGVVGEQAMVVWYISTDGQSLAWGSTSEPYGINIIFYKQP
jgi:hypothetical protein